MGVVLPVPAELREEPQHAGIAKSIPQHGLLLMVESVSLFRSRSPLVQAETDDTPQVSARPSHEQRKEGDEIGSMVGGNGHGRAQN